MELNINGESVQIDLVLKETSLREHIKAKITAPGREVYLIKLSIPNLDLRVHSSFGLWHDHRHRQGSFLTQTLAIGLILFVSTPSHSKTYIY